MSLAIVTLSTEGLRVAQKLVAAMPGATLYVHRDIEPTPEGAQSFARVIELTAAQWSAWREIVYILPCGVAARAIAPHIEHKLRDPAVVCLDVFGRWAVSLLSGHEGGANDLALRVSNIIGAEPIITTTTEAVKRHIVGVGCKRGISGAHITAFIQDVLRENAIDIATVRYLATVDLKADEPGLQQAAATLGIPLRIITRDEISQIAGAFAGSDFVMQAVGVPCVAEPAAMLAGRRTRLLIPRQARDGVTVAVAREDSA